MAFVSTNKAPGVYIDEVQVPGPITPAPTAIAAFVGPAQIGPLLKPTLLTNAQQFTQQFGSYITDPQTVYVTHAVNGFFAEGGGQCYFVRVGTGVQAGLALNDRTTSNPMPTLQVTALKEGVAGNSVTVQVDDASIASTTATRNQISLVSASGSTAKIANADASKFNPGDIVTLEKGAINDRPTITSITQSTSADLVLTAALTHSYTTGDVQKGPGPKIPIVSASGTTITVAAGDAVNFVAGDTVTITGGGNTEGPTIASIAIHATVTFGAPLAHTYDNTADMRTADLMPGQQRIHVNSVTGIEPGSYVSFTQGGTTEAGVVRTVDTINSSITLTNGLANLYSQASGAANPSIAVQTLEFTLTIVGPTSGTEIFKNLSMDPRHSRYFAEIVSSAAVDVELADPPSPSLPAKNLPKVIAATPLQNGKADNIAALTTADFHKGIDTFLRIDEVNLLCIPDSVGGTFQAADTQDIQAYMLAHCEKVVNRFAILDPRSETWTAALDLTQILAQRAGISSDRGMGSLYYPWIAISNPLGSGRVLVPPSGHIAGVYANNDNTRGVFKAPANEAIVSALDLSRVLTDDENGVLNEPGIDVIRAFPGQGIRIWGARTVAPSDITQWRYNSIRRFVNFVEASLRDGSRFAVFEPNNPSLWGTVKRLVTDFLTAQWQQGALEGTTPDQGFSVRVDATLNTPEIIALGQLIIQVTLFTVPPAEFVVFQIIQEPGGSSVSE